MKLLLDTNVFLWASLEPARLSQGAYAAIVDPKNERYVSVATLWEMQIKHALGKLDLPGNVDLIARTWLTPLAATLLSIEPRHLGSLYHLAPLHRDPFDRLLVAQALCDGMSLVSADRDLLAYPVPIVW